MRQWAPWRGGPGGRCELASAYADRADLRPGMLRDSDVVVTAFTRLGWTWGARFSAPIDTMHFSATGN